MAHKTKRIQSQSGFVTYLRTSDAEVQAPERSQAAQRRDIQQRLIAYHDISHLIFNSVLSHTMIYPTLVNTLITSREPLRIVKTTNDC